MPMKLSSLQGKQLRWYVVLPLLGMIVLLFAMMLSRNATERKAMQENEAFLRTQLSESVSNEQALRVKLSNSGSKETLTGEARTLSFVRPSEICFQVENAEDLDKYTQAEWAIIQEERSLGR